MREFETYVDVRTKATIGSWNISSIIKDEIPRLLGGSDRFIRDGIIRESDYRFNGSEEIREATLEEIELYNALFLVQRYFEKCDIHK